MYPAWKRPENVGRKQEKNKAIPVGLPFKIDKSHESLGLKADKSDENLGIFKIDRTHESLGIF